MASHRPLWAAPAQSFLTQCARDRIIQPGWNDVAISEGWAQISRGLGMTKPREPLLTAFRDARELPSAETPRRFPSLGLCERSCSSRLSRQDAKMPRHLGASSNPRWLYPAALIRNSPAGRRLRYYSSAVPRSAGGGTAMAREPSPIPMSSTVAAVRWQPRGQPMRTNRQRIMRKPYRRATSCDDSHNWFAVKTLCEAERGALPGRKARKQACLEAI